MGTQWTTSAKSSRIVIGKKKTMSKYNLKLVTYIYFFRSKFERLKVVAPWGVELWPERDKQRTATLHCEPNTSGLYNTWRDNFSRKN